MNDKVAPIESNIEPASGVQQGIGTWWQWLLVYPGLVLGLLGSIPTLINVYHSLKNGVPISKAQDSVEQTELWQNNFACVDGAQFNPITNPDNVRIGAVVCHSGDVLLQAQRPSWRNASYRWVHWSDIAPPQGEQASIGALLGHLADAAGADRYLRVQVQQVPMRVICQRWVGNGLLLQLIWSSQGCFDQLVNTYTGLVVSRSPAYCSNQC
jgi:hypothetical protein